MSEEDFDKSMSNDEERREGNSTSDNGNNAHSERPRFVRRERIGNESGYRPRFNPNNNYGGGEGRSYQLRPNNRYNNYGNNNYGGSGASYNSGAGAHGDADPNSEERPNRMYRPRYNAGQGGGNYQRVNNYDYNSERPDYNRVSPQEGGYSQENRFNKRPGYNYNRYNNQGAPRQGYQPRDNHGMNRGGGYGQYGGNRYQQRGYNEGGYNGGNAEGGYNNNYGGYNNGGNYGNQGGYSPRGGYNQRGGQGGYNPRGGHNQGGFKKRPAFNAKYNQKKRLEYKEVNYDPNEPVRLNKFLANAGVCSRRDADKFITSGVVKVNGEVVTELGTKVLRSDVILFHDAPVKMEKKVYVLLNKPKGYVTTSEDPQNRKTVMELVRTACPERIYPVGRLDRNTTGVLLFTNDGELASKLTHPKFLKKKIYHVYLDHAVTAADLQQISEGITLEDGEIKADDVQYASPTDKKQVGIEIHSGKNRIVRRIFEHLGYHVTKLDRVYFAGLTKKNVKRGDWRYLTEKEVDMLRMGAFE